MPETRKLRYAALDEIAGAARNPKGHDLTGIQSSIARFGYVAPALVDERTGTLVAGHGRILALRAMRDAGQAPPAGVRVDGDGVWQVPVLAGWSSRSDAEADAYLIADNEWTVRGGWDDRELADMLTELADTDLLTLTGFSEADLTDLLDTYNPAGLDELAGRVGAGEDTELWPTVRVKVPPPVYAEYSSLMKTLNGEDHDKFLTIIRTAAGPLGSVVDNGGGVET